MDKLYAKALDDLAHKDGTNTKSLVADLTKHLVATGRTKLLPGILRQLKIIEARRAKLAPSVEVASQSEAAHALKEAAASGITATKAHVNHALITGWRARSGGTLIDRSAKRGLIDIYRNVTR
jgi:F0F1-type ATP synthase delta subunit